MASFRVSQTVSQDNEIDEKETDTRGSRIVDGCYKRVLPASPGGLDTIDSSNQLRMFLSTCLDRTCLDLSSFAL